ncbi:site-specific integrase [Arthrobacter sp. H20]|uniref:tyrosine-type recombinase/integrase n=1 Tax=Arthrobacter sp. H20 TaxID=1267981 RepID=UPI00047C9C37|nr:site-specific integrase [Arthrobacter sp. H20]
MARIALEPGGPHGDPSFSKDGKKHVCSVYYRDSHGERHRMKATGATKMEASEKLEAKFEDLRRSGPDALVRSSTTIAELSELWLASLRDLAPGTMTTYRNRVRISIIPTMGSKKIGEATTGYIEGQLRKIAAGGVKDIGSSGKVREIKTGGRTAEFTARTVLKMMFDFALDHRAVPGHINPVGRDRSAKERKAQRGEVRALTAQEYSEMYRRTAAWQEAQQYGPRRGKDLLVAADVLLGTGVRTGELLAMRHEDLWLRDQIPFFLVTGTITQDEKTKKFFRQDYTKGDTAQLKRVQPIALPAHVTGLLLYRQEELGKKRPTGLVFTNQFGGLVLPPNFRRSWRKARSFDARGGDDFSWVTPKSLRKSAATLVAKTEGLDAAMRQLRHSSNTVTNNHYVDKLMPMVDNRAAFDGIFAGRSIPRR